MWNGIIGSPCRTRKDGKEKNAPTYPSSHARLISPGDRRSILAHQYFEGFRQCQWHRRAQRAPIIQFVCRPSPSNIGVTSSTGKTVLDGEIVCLDKRGRPQFRDLLFHRGEPCFYAFDLSMFDGKDLRSERLTDRKQELRPLLSKVSVSSALRYADHVEQHGTALFQRVCEMDLEGIVAKHSFGGYVTEQERTT